MKLILAIVHNEDTDALLRALAERGFRPTIAASAGGFLRWSNTTLGITADDERVDEVLAVIQTTCHVPAEPRIYVPGLGTRHIGAATVFVLDVERHEHC